MQQQFLAIQEIGMNAAPHLVNSDAGSAAASLHGGSERDATFYLPLGGGQPGAGGLAITLTSEEQTRAEVLALINRRYAWRGYGSDHKLSGRHEETTFSARQGGLLIGTVTLAADSASGLALDVTFPQEMQFFRRKPNVRICELKKLAMECSSDSKPVLASLFHFVFMFGTNTYLGTDLLIEVNPRHAAFYERMLGFRRAGAVRTNASVSAPSQLMWLAVSDIEAAIAARNDEPYKNSLYKYFYSQQVEDRIVSQLNERALREKTREAMVAPERNSNVWCLSS